MHAGGAPGFNLRQSLLLEGSDHDLVALCACGIEHEKGKHPVAGNQTELLLCGIHSCESVALSHAAIPRSRQLPSTSRELLNHSPFRRLDEADQQGDVFSEVAFFLQFLQGLGGVQL